MQVSSSQLKSICPLAPADLAVADLNAILTAVGAASVQRAAMVIGQMAIESNYFRTLEEDPASYGGKPYVPYYGRSWIQLTWKRNYEATGQRLGIDLVNHPELALEKNVAVCTDFWLSMGLNAFADDNDCDGATRKINGPAATQDSLDLRRKYYTRALAVLGSADPDFSDVVGGSSTI